MGSNGAGVGGWARTFIPDGPVTVASVEFLSSQQVKARLNRSLSRPDDQLLCFVTLTGKFTRPASDPGGPNPRLSTPVQSTSLFLLFDALNGNIIAMGELGK